ncbi:protein lin-37 homolog isoform X1 [Pieris napi]|uniref:protein lin-37 homolog isoform X1 n=1 Tax=Pieris napi TaxID=78633 RepID=UPI001FBA5078|nr:protein lin-37 homolog isoform X1 [Pieris napi]
MPRRRRFTPLKNKRTPKKEDDPKVDQEVTTARGRLKGALMEILEPSAGIDSDNSSDYVKKDKKSTSSESSSDEEDRLYRAPQRQSYVLKLFDRSVDLSQFSDETPLYPICRAWIINQPKSDYRKISILNMGESMKEENDSVHELPDPDGPVISRVPNLIPEQVSVNKDNIYLNYEHTLPTKDELLSTNMKRWSKVRIAWQDQSQLVHQRYAATQDVLNKLNVNGL